MGMASEHAVSVRHLTDENRIEIALLPGFTRKELDVVRVRLYRYGWVGGGG